jgi:hypothetical protein
MIGESKNEWEKPDVAEFLSLDEYIEAINLKVYRNNKEECYLRKRLWWAFNDRIREGKEIFLNEKDKETYETNCTKLIELLDKNTEDGILMCAELYRNIGNYIECINILETMDKKDYPVLKDKIKKECHDNNKNVIEY